MACKDGWCPSSHPRGHAHQGQELRGGHSQQPRALEDGTLRVRVFQLLVSTHLGGGEHVTSYPVLQRFSLPWEEKLINAVKNPRPAGRGARLPTPAVFKYRPDNRSAGTNAVPLWKGLSLSLGHPRTQCDSQQHTADTRRVLFTE